MTRLGEISPLWQNMLRLWQTFDGFLVFGNILNLLWRKFYAIGLNFIVLNGQTLNSYLAIGHCGCHEPFSSSCIRKFTIHLIRRLQPIIAEATIVVFGVDPRFNKISVD